ncbi:small acid-soluble spore protein Tlp [Lysinibacillus sp. 54212]|uniref:small acid-soluble spore protein Tlp n=1 Tax=Lysinibacillus sp. 54212 TaxID=3119829 RepID=UPI002FCA19BB
MSNQHQPNPDDRSNNVERLNSMVQDTIDNLNKSQETLKNAGREERQRIEEKNKRREQSISAMRAEIEDEAASRERGYH